MSENKREKIYTVALLVSAWIETTVDDAPNGRPAGRTPRECVD